MMAPAVKKKSTVKFQNEWLDKIMDQLSDIMHAACRPTCSHGVKVAASSACTT